MSASTAMTKDRLDEVVQAVKVTLAKDDLRLMSQRVVQAKVWHLQPVVAGLLSDLRREEEDLRSTILKRISALVYRFHDHTLDATLARADLIKDPRVHGGSSLDRKETFDLFCLDAKERLYMTLKQYGWLEDFFRRYPIHFYENSFAFVNRIPIKKLPLSVKVVGMGIGGSTAVSGLAKVGIQSVTGYEKRADGTTSGVGSRYQNASWRAYDIAEHLLDETAFNHLLTYRQKLNVTYDDGSTAVVTSDRVQIILGNAIAASLASAKRYGANLVFGSQNIDFFRDNDEVDEEEHADIVALFTGAHTSEIFPYLREEMDFMEWPELRSSCKMWLCVKESDKSEDFCSRGGEIGAERWHYTIESARKTPEDIERIQNNLARQDQDNFKRKHLGEDEEKELRDKNQSQMTQVQKVLAMVTDTANITTPRFDYIFTNAPDNEHNRSKCELAASKGTVVLDGGYTVDVKIARKSVVFGRDGSSTSGTAQRLLKGFSSRVIVVGGDACVNPNPLAAYGATLACQAAGMLVQLAVSHGHIKAILMDASMTTSELTKLVDPSWLTQLQELRDLFTEYYDARSRSENYFQFVQTLICNLYSLPKQV